MWVHILKGVDSTAVLTLPAKMTNFSLYIFSKISKLHVWRKPKLHRKDSILAENFTNMEYNEQFKKDYDDINYFIGPNIQLKRFRP